MRIDAHQHFWSYNSAMDTWISDEMIVLKKNYLPDQLREILKNNQLDGSVLVQVDQTEDETLSLLETAEKYDFIKGVVGWVDLRDENIEERLEYFQSYPKLKGFRHIVQSEPDDHFLLQSNFKRGIRALQKYNFTYDLLFYHYQMKEVVKFCDIFNEQNLVVDHIGKPDIKNQSIKEWSKHLKALSAHDNVYCKISGMVTEASWKGWQYEDFVPYLDIVFDCFGTERIMYGSDWPVCLLSTSYENQLDIIKQYIAPKTPSIKAKIMGLNAINFYNL